MHMVIPVLFWICVFIFLFLVIIELVKSGLSTCKYGKWGHRWSKWKQVDAIHKKRVCVDCGKIEYKNIYEVF